MDVSPLSHQSFVLATKNGAHMMTSVNDTGGADYYVKICGEAGDKDHNAILIRNMDSLAVFGDNFMNIYNIYSLNNNYRSKSEKLMQARRVFLDNFCSAAGTDNISFHPTWMGSTGSQTYKYWKDNIYPYKDKIQDAVKELERIVKMPLEEERNENDCLGGGSPSIARMDDACPICLGNIDNVSQETTDLPSSLDMCSVCCHLFHKSCLERWKQTKADAGEIFNCPCCRSELPVVSFYNRG